MDITPAQLPLTTSMSNFAAFRASFKGDLLTPADAGYDAAIARWAKNAARRAAVVALVKDAEDVSRAIIYAQLAKLPIAIRGGGHNAAGASSSEGGLVIDLSRYLNGATIDPENKLGYVGGGAVWETVDKAAIQHGLATVGGTVNHVSRLLASPIDMILIHLRRLVWAGTWPECMHAMYTDISID